MNIETDTSTLTFLRDNLGTVTPLDVPEDQRERAYFAAGGKVFPCPLPTPPGSPWAVDLSTLSGLARMIVANVDRLDLGRHLVVASAAQAELLGPLSAVHRTREQVAVASYRGTGLDGLLGDWHTVPALVPMLGVHFEQGGDMGRLVALLSDVTVKNARVQKREGLGFRVTVETGGEGGGWTEVESPFFSLHPFRSFPEAGAQQPSLFMIDMTIQKPDDDGAGTPIVRMQLADGHGWEPRAAEQVGWHFQGLLDAEAETAGPRAAETPKMVLPTVVW